jgi:hypothetical protein
MWRGKYLRSQPASPAFDVSASCGLGEVGHYDIWVRHHLVMMARAAA